MWGRHNHYKGMHYRGFAPENIPEISIAETILGKRRGDYEKLFEVYQRRLASDADVADHLKVIEYLLNDIEKIKKRREFLKVKESTLASRQSSGSMTGKKRTCLERECFP